MSLPGLRCFSLTFCLLCTISFLQAQEKEKGSTYGLIGLHAQQISVDDFNKQSAALGYPALDNSFGEIAGGWATETGRWRSSYLFILGQSEAENATGAVRLQTAGFGIGLAYNFLPNEKWFLGPEARFTFRGDQVVLSDEVTVTGIANAQQTKYVKFTRFALPIDLSLNFQRTFRFANSPNSLLVLTLQGGYRLAASDAAWQIDQAVNVEETGLNLDGFVGALQIGFRF